MSTYKFNKTSNQSLQGSGPEDLSRLVNWIYEYPFGRDVEETDFWTSNEFNKSMFYVVKLQRKENNISYKVFQDN